MVAFLDNRNAERANAREARRTAMETVSKTTGNTTGTKAVKNTEEFWIQVTNRIKSTFTISTEKDVYVHSVYNYGRRLV